MTTIPFRILLSACGLFFFCHLTMAAGPSLLSIELSHDLQIRGLKIPLGQLHGSKPTVSLFFGEITVEPMRLGFLRIGLIPQPVASGMRVEILEPQGGVGWVADFARFAAGEPALERMDIRGIEFHSSIKDVVSVRADKAQFVASDRILRLRTGEVHAEGQPVHRFMEGEVHLEGAKAGQLEWQEGGRTHRISLNGPPSAPGGEARLPRETHVPEQSTDRASFRAERGTSQITPDVAWEVPRDARNDSKECEVCRSLAPLNERDAPPLLAQP